MNATQFIEIIKKSEYPEKSDILALKKVQENFPYFQIPHVLTARFDYLKNQEKHGEALGFAAITSPDRVWLKELIEKKPSTAEEAFKSKKKEDLLPEEAKGKKDPNLRTQSLVKLGNDLKGSPSPDKKPTEEKPKPVRRKRRAPKDDLIETIKRKEKKTIVDAKKKEQIDLIKAFSKKSIKMATIKEIEANQNTENLAEKSTKINDNLISESFAKLLVSQGKKPKAKQIYEKLMLKFPDKRSYFADLIEKLKE